MTKKEKLAVNKFILSIIRTKNKVMVPATRFNKKAKPGFSLVAIPLKDVIRNWKKLHATLEGKSK
jgi:hypothetical protein